MKYDNNDITLPDNIDSDICFYGEGYDEKFNTYYEIYKFTTVHGKPGIAFIPNKEVATSDSALYKCLAEKGCRIPKTSKARSALLALLEAQRDEKKGTIINVAEQIGWTSEKCQRYVLPDKMYGHNDKELHFSGRVPPAQNFDTSGTLEDWRKHNVKPSTGNSNMMLSLAASFAPPLMFVSGIRESGGFQLVGPTRIGKTTCQLIGRSVWGKEIANWNSTLAGIGKDAICYNDTVLFIDETGQAENKEIILNAIYNLAGGRGKNKSTDDNAKYSWRLIFFSSSEITIDQIAEEVGKQIKDGQRSRMIDINAVTQSGTAIENIHGQANSKAFVDMVGAACQQYYGTAGGAYLEQLVAWAASDKKGLQKWLKDKLNSYLKRADVDLNDGILSSIASRFALVYAAGRLAKKFDIVPWDKDEMFEAIHACHKRIMLPQAVLDKRKSIIKPVTVKPEDCVKRVRIYVKKHKASFLKASKASGKLTKEELEASQGIRYKNQKGNIEYLFTSECFRKAVCRDYPTQTVIAALKAKHLLIKSSLQRPLLKGKGTSRVVAIKEAIIVK